jgi:putative heme-binding domain-containing protein
MNLESSNKDIAGLLRELSLVFGDGRAIEELLEIASSGTTNVPERRAALRSLVLAKDPGVLPLLKSLLDNRDLCQDAIQGLAAYGDAETPKLLISKFQGFNAPSRQAAITTLVSRPEFANTLLDAISDGVIERSIVSAFQVRQIQNMGNEQLRTRATALWSDLLEQSQEKSALIGTLQQTLTPDELAKANASQGRILFKNRCATCHVLYGEGERIAPELTGAQRSSLNYLLENIIDPSATVSPNYKLTVALLSDGRVINGLVTATTEKTLTLQTASEQVLVDREEIETLRESAVSMMPENLLLGLDDQQIKELFAYLMTTAQVPLPSNN